MDTLVQDYHTQELPPDFFKGNTYEVVSIVAYLIGVPTRIFENEHEPPKMESFEQLETNKNARIIRNLCMLRTAIEKNFKHINDAFRYSYKSILSVPEYIPQACIYQLQSDGVDFIRKSSTKLTHHIIEINKILSDRINNCKSIFPLWLNWQYIRDLFIMPNGFTEEGTRAAAQLYYGSKNSYPYQMYINWRPADDGNILFSDRKFVKLLYKQHNDYFSEDSKVSDAGSGVKTAIYDYINDSTRTVVVVDCENSDPYKLCATLKNLDYEVTQKITKIILFDDIHTATAWRILESYTKIPVEHMMIERIKMDKSLVDIKLTARACQEHYRNQVDSFIIVSSDSDYWGLISSLPEARFLVMVEHEKCGRDIKDVMDEAGIFYCFIDDFYSGNIEDIKQQVLFNELNGYLHRNLHINIHTMMDEALRATRIAMTASERTQFIGRHLKAMQLQISEQGDVSLELKRK